MKRTWVSAVLVAGVAAGCGGYRATDADPATSRPVPAVESPAPAPVAAAATAPVTAPVTGAAAVAAVHALRQVAASCGVRHPRDIQYVVAWHRAALRVLDAGSEPSNDRVYALTARGHFVANNVSRPPGAAAPHGRLLEVVVDVRSGDVTDWGLQRTIPDLNRLGPVHHVD